MSEIIGHEEILNRFIRRSKNHSFSHANLIVGSDGIGKSLIAKYLANQILSEKYNTETVDIINYYPTSNTSFGVDDVRTVIDEVNKKPYEHDKKVVILYKCDKMTAQAQNALLKTIEEPPEGVYIILLSDSIEMILDTIQSRCQVYKLTPLSQTDMDLYIEKKYNTISIQDKQAALAYSMGIPGKVDMFIKDEKLKNIRNITINMFQDITKRDRNFVIKYEKELSSFNNEKFDLLDIILLYIRDIELFKELNDKEKIINFDKASMIESISRNIPYKKLNSMLEYIKEARESFKSNSNYSMTISVLLMGFVEGKI